ncbi:Vacuolar protein sorting-associated protein 5 [Spathaspora sp. JA1]|nr:Vacuolar protein sorting-associated protein 5 [Spathaspora sp. JA1]
MDNEDLTASHWDDVLSPNEFTSTSNTTGTNSLHQSIIPPLTNQFNGINIDDPFASPLGYGQNQQTHEEDEEEDDEEEENTGQQQIDRHREYTSPSPFYNSNQAEYEQIQEMRKEQRKEHKHQLLSELTHGSEDSELLQESSIIPDEIPSSESLFQDKGSPIKVDSKLQQANISSPSKTIKFKQSQFKPTRPRKFSAKLNVKHLSSNSNNQLGPLGVNEDDDEKTKTTERTNNAESIAKQVEAPLYSLTPKKGPTSEVVPTYDTPVKKKKPIEEEEPNEQANNKLEISVGDPMKVGDITTAHIVYTIKTINKNLTSDNFPKNDSNEVTRRYRDFRWIYHQLQNNHPGKIIPPPPTKQTYIGRFNENFIENRRLSLEKMLNKISQIRELCNDGDFVMFLTSDDFVNESRERERLSGSAASTQNSEYLDRPAVTGGAGAVGDTESSTGSLSPISSSATTTSGGGAGGFMSSLFSISTKINEPDEYFTDQKQYIDDLEFNLKQFYKAIELIGQQRLDLIGILEEISLTIDELANLEISKITSDLLIGFSEIQLKIRDNLDRINLQDQLTLGFTIEEYLRIIGSIKFIFETRLKIYQQYYNFNQELIKKQGQLDKLSRKYRNAGGPQMEKMNQLSFEVDKLKQKTNSYETSFNQISETIKLELENFEFERIDDFRNSVEIFIESSIESQKESIELYETFYERQKLASV